jgi:ribosomal-protein-alanine N-acetyltransferase
MGFEELSLKRIVAYVQRSNQPSLRLLSRLGFTYEGTARSFANIQGNWIDHDQFSLIAD